MHPVIVKGISVAAEMAIREVGIRLFYRNPVEQAKARHAAQWYAIQNPNNPHRLSALIGRLLS